MQISFTFLYLKSIKISFIIIHSKFPFVSDWLKSHNKLALLTKGILYGDLPFMPYTFCLAPSPRLSYIFCIPPQIPTFPLPDKKIKCHLPLFIIYLFKHLK